MKSRIVKFKALVAFSILPFFSVICQGGAFANGFALASTSNTINSGIYTGLGFGLSHFDPTLIGETSHTVEDQNSAGGHIFFGAFFNPRVSGEINAAELGTLEFGPTGNVEYRVFAASALAHLSRSGYRIGSFTFNPFLRAGVRHYAIEADNVRVTDQAETSLLFGAGMNVPLTRQIGLRFDAISYSKDAVVLQAGVMLQPWAAKVGNGPLALETVMKEGKPFNDADLQHAAALPQDSDNDLISDTIDECPNTLPKLVVENTGCPVYNGIVSGVNFEYDSDRLTLNAQRVLDKVAETLQQHPRSAVDIHAYTDSSGSDAYNQRLSKLRANAVSDFLIKKGINQGRLTTKGYGEQSPVDTNATAEGRANNRRVELFAYRPE